MIDRAQRRDAVHAVMDDALIAMAAAVRAGTAEPPPTCWGKNPARDWAIILARYRDGRTLRDIGREHGISGQQVRVVTCVTARRCGQRRTCPSGRSGGTGVRVECFGAAAVAHERTP